MTVDFTVSCVRYSDDPQAMSAFAEVVGLSRRISSATSGYVDLAGAAGLLMVHPADDDVATGTTELSYEVEDLDDAVAAVTTELSADAVIPIWDEAYGRHAAVRDPRENVHWITERQRDLYGYSASPPRPGPVRVTAVRYSADFAADVPFYGVLGFTADPSGGPDWQPMVGRSPSAGVIGLHVPDPADPTAGRSGQGRPPLGPRPLVKLSFDTTEDLERLRARLITAGHADAQIVHDGAAVKVHVTDPDGRQVEIHAR